MQKVVINRRRGGFSLSTMAVDALNLNAEDFIEVFGVPRNLYVPRFSDDYRCRLERDDPRLIGIVEFLGLEADGDNSHLVIVDVPDGVKWQIGESRTGIEWVEEVHRTWVGHDDRFIDYEWCGGNDDDAPNS